MILYRYTNWKSTIQTIKEDLVTVLIPLGANHYGRITKVVKWDDVHKSANLKKKMGLSEGRSAGKCNNRSKSS